MKREDLTEKLLDIKREKGWSWKHICEKIGGYSEVLITGAILGQIFVAPLCLLAGFWLLRVYDIHIATYAAAAINIAVAVLSFLLSRGPISDSEVVEGPRGPRDWPVLIAIFCSGAAALGAEIA